jgi:hypothetical protein
MKQRASSSETGRPLAPVPGVPSSSASNAEKPSCSQKEKDEHKRNHAEQNFDCKSVQIMRQRPIAKQWRMLLGSNALIVSCHEYID